MKRVLACCQQNFSRGSKVYELRTYNVKPNNMPQFLKLTNEWIHLRTKASPLLGYWTTEMGGLNQVVHIWEYDNLEDRANVRAGLKTNEEWNSKYIGQVSGMWDSQTNALLQSKCPIVTPATSGVYELRAYTDPETVKAIKQLNYEPGVPDEATRVTESATLVGVWDTLIGETTTCYELWHYQTLNQVYECPGTWHFYPPSHTKLLLPTQFSPLQ